MFAIFKRELKTYFSTPTGYVFLALFLLITGIFFSLANLLTLNSTYAPYLGGVLFLFLLCVPILTMRLISEETKQKTDQLLLTSPVRIFDIVFGKFMAAVSLFLIALAVTFLYPVIIALYGSLDLWETVGAYIGFIFLGSAFIAIGMYVSATTENQVIAAIVTFASLLIVWILDFIKENVPSDKISGMIFAAALFLIFVIWIYSATRNLLILIAVSAAGIIAFSLLFFLSGSLFIGFIGKTIGWLSLLGRYQSLSMGILKINTIIYYLSISVFFNYLTIRLIEKRRWI